MKLYGKYFIKLDDLFVNNRHVKPHQNALKQYNMHLLNKTTKLCRVCGWCTHLNNARIVVKWRRSVVNEGMYDSLNACSRISTATRNKTFIPINVGAGYNL